MMMMMMDAPPQRARETETGEKKQISSYLFLTSVVDIVRQMTSFSSGEEYS